MFDTSIMDVASALEFIQTTCYLKHLCIGPMFVQEDSFRKAVVPSWIYARGSAHAFTIPSYTAFV